MLGVHLHESACVESAVIVVDLKLVFASALRVHFPANALKNGVNAIVCKTFRNDLIGE